MKTKEELAEEILQQIIAISKKMDNVFSDQKSDALNRIAISNLYIALSNLTS